jgi:hypothetical protein
MNANKRTKNAICEYCGVTFPAQRSTARFCSTAHRSAAHREALETVAERVLQQDGHSTVVELPDGSWREYVRVVPVDGYAVPKALLATLDAHRKEGEDDSQTLLRLGLLKLAELAGADTPVRKRLVRRVDRRLPGSPQPVDKHAATAKQPVRYESQKMAELAREALRDHDAEDWDVPVIGSS